MKLVRENIQFKRGSEPKDSMQLGKFKDKSRAEYEDELARLREYRKRLDGHHPGDDSPIDSDETVSESRAWIRQKINDINDILDTPEKKG